FYLQAVELQEKAIAKAPGDWDIRTALAATYTNVGLLQWWPLGQQTPERIEKATVYHSKAQQLYRQLVKEYPGHALSLRQLATNSANLGSLWDVPAKSLEAFREAAQAEQRIMEQCPTPNEAWKKLSLYRRYICYTLAGLHRHEEAKVTAMQAL